MGVACIISPITPILIAAAIAISGLLATQPDWASTLPPGEEYGRTMPDGDTFAAQPWHAFATHDGDANHEPVATVGPHQIVTSGDTVYLTGNATDADGDILEYMWLDATSRGPDYTIANNDTLSASFTAPFVTNTTHIFVVLYALDEHSSGYDVMIITVNPSHVPSVNAGSDQTVDENALVNLAGAFRNIEGNLTFHWDHNSLLDITFDNPDLLFAQFAAPPVTSDTEFAITLTVSNGTGTGTTTLSDTLILTILDSGNTPPVVEAGHDQTVYEGSQVSLSASASDDDNDHLNYSWSQNPDEPAIQFNNPNSLAPSFTAPTVDYDTTFTLTLKVDDGTDAANDTLELVVRNIDLGSNPAIELGPSQIVREGDDITLLPVVSNIEGNVTYEWSQIPSTPAIDFGTSTPVTFTAPLVDDDTLFALTVTASNGTGSDGVSVSDTLALTVTDSRALTADAGQSRNVDDSGPVVLSGSGSDPDGDDLTYQWVQDSGPSVPITGDQTANPSFTPPDVNPKLQSTLAFTLTVTDTAGKSATDTVTITVYNAGEVPSSKSRNSKNVGSLALDLGTLEPSGLVKLSEKVTQYIGAFDQSKPLAPATPPFLFDPPVAINENAYLLGSVFNTLEPRAIRAGENASIAFVTYSSHEITSFIMYMHPHGTNLYQNGDTFVQFYGGQVRTVDPHGLISYANITVTPDAKTTYKYLVQADVEFAGAMEPTGMVVRSWNTQAASTLVRIVNAFEVLPPAVQTVLGAPESDAPAPEDATPTEPEPIPEDATPTEPEPIPEDATPTESTPETPAVSLMHALRMWAGFDVSVISDAELLAFLALDYPGADIPSWMMTELAPAVVKERIVLATAIRSP